MKYIKKNLKHKKVFDIKKFKSKRAAIDQRVYLKIKKKKKQEEINTNSTTMVTDLFMSLWIFSTDLSTSCLINNKFFIILND